MQEIPTNNKNTRLEKGKHVGGSIGKKESIFDVPKLDKRGMSTSDYR